MTQVVCTWMKCMGSITIQNSLQAYFQIELDSKVNVNKDKDSGYFFQFHFESRRHTRSLVLISPQDLTTSQSRSFCGLAKPCDSYQRHEEPDMEVNNTIPKMSRDSCPKYVLSTRHGTSTDLPRAGVYSHECHTSDCVRHSGNLTFFFLLDESQPFLCLAFMNVC